MGSKLSTHTALVHSQLLPPARVPPPANGQAEAQAGIRIFTGQMIARMVASDRRFLIARDPSREQALAQLRALARPLPPGFRFSRDDANERGG